MLKKIFLVLLISTLQLSSIAYAQQPKVLGGLKIGGNLNLPNWDPEPPFGNLSSGISFNFGGLVDIDISKNFGIEINVLYNNQKTNWDFREFDPYYGVIVDGDATFTLQSISLPVLAKVKFPSKQATPFLGIGPEIGFILSHKGKIKITANGLSDEATTDLMDSTGTLNFGIVLCFGVDIDLNEVRLTPEIRFNLGLVDLDESSTIAKSSQISLFFGVKF